MYYALGEVIASHLYPEHLSLGKHFPISTLLSSIRTLFISMRSFCIILNLIYILVCLILPLMNDQPSEESI